MLNLLNFQKPQRYLGNEINVVKKDHFGKISFCLCYPNFYEIGMDNLGLRIIYGLLNSYSGLVCERAFLPGQDLLDFLKNEKQPLFSLETKTPLNEFDLIGFNFGYELNYLNFLEMLDAGMVPLLSKQRKNIIVIGGGIANPQPLADFVDIFFLGEFEAASDKLVAVLKKYKNKPDRLKALSKIEGFYAPQFYNSSFLKNRYCFKPKYPFANSLIKRVVVKKLDKSFFPLNWITPHTKLSQDRVGIEIARGCPNNCNFCQARNIYYPYREKKVKTIVNTLKAAYKKTGYESFSLLSLSAFNYSQIEKLVEKIFPFLKKNKISLSLPSLRIGKKIAPIYKKLLSIQKTSLTVAVEAGTDSLRKRLNKNIAVDELFSSAQAFYNLGLNLIKLYFMYGFPGEENEDLLAIGNFVRMLSKQAPFKINISINLFIPKPFSPWEKMPLSDINQARQKEKIILGNMPKGKRIKISFSNLDQSLIEAIVSRGDKELMPAFINLHKRRKKLLEKKSLFSWPVWEETLKQEGIDWQRYIRVNTKNFPWSFIN